MVVVALCACTVIEGYEIIKIIVSSFLFSTVSNVGDKFFAVAFMKKVLKFLEMIFCTFH